MDKLIVGRHVFDTEIVALEATKNELGDVFCEIVDLIIACKGKIIITGMGKPGHIAAKLAATFSSLGIPAFRVHPAEAMHGDLGMISEDDLVIVISFSGESEEIVKILPIVKIIGAKIVGITGNIDSVLAKSADVVQVLPKFKEACNLGLAPTSSTTSVLCYGDALAIVASSLRGFDGSDFGFLHPAWSLGKKLILKVDDLMSKGEDVPCVVMGTYLMDAIPIMSKKGLGIITIVDESNKLQGIICDGDLRRIIEKRVDIYSVTVDEVMISKPKTYNKNKLAVDALRYIKGNSINNLPIVDENNVLEGVITWQQIVKAGIMI